MKTWPENWKAAYFSQETGEAFVELLTVNHPNLAAPIRLTSHPQGTTSRGQVFIFFPFQFVLPDDTQESPGRASIRIDNIDRTILAALRGLADPPTILYEIVLESDPDYVGVTVAFLWRATNWDTIQIESSLEFEDIGAEPFPGFDFVPAHFKSFPQ